MKSSNDDIVWSDHSLTIREVVDKTIPTVVRVAEGFYGGNEAESFSRGDLLKLDFVKSIQKVCATIISSRSQAIIEDETGYMQPDKEIVIPLGYKGKVVITRPPTEYKVYVTVAELMHDFPRFVRVDKPFFVQSKDNIAIQIKAGKKLELDRYLPTQGLIAKYENETVVINNSIKSRFVPLPDDTEYTLTEIVDRLPLPQFVTFVGEEFKRVLTTDLLEAVDNIQSFTGCVKLNRIFREEVVVGYHKPQIPECLKNEYSKNVRRSIVLLPLSRDAVNEIEVNVPIYSEPHEYELLVISNFSQKSAIEDIIDGSLYLEFARNPRGFYLIDKEVPLNEKPEEAPPIPSRPRNHSKVEIVGPVEDHPDFPNNAYDECDGYIQLTQSSKPKRPVSMSFYEKLKSVRSEIKAKITSKDRSSTPHQLNIAALVSPPIPPSQPKPKPHKPQTNDSSKLPPVPQSLIRPILRVQPSTRVVSTTSMGVSQMSVKELVLCLNQCAFPQLAKLCDENTIDGKFIFGLQEHELRDKPYSLNKIEMLKFKKMKEGWRPKID